MKKEYMTIGQAKENIEKNIASEKKSSKRAFLGMSIFTVFVSILLATDLFTGFKVRYIFGGIVMIVVVGFLISLFWKTMNDRIKQVQKELKDPIIITGEILRKSPILVTKNDEIITIVNSGVRIKMINYEESDIEYSTDLINWEITNGSFFVTDFPNKLYLRTQKNDFTLHSSSQPISEQSKQKAKLIIG